MRTLKTLLIAGSLVLAAAAPAVMAGPGRGGFDGHQLMEMLDDVGASDAQRQQIQAIFRTAREDLRAQMKDGMGQRQQMLQLWAAPNIDAAALDALRKQQLQQQERVGSRLQQAMVEAGRVLTPEQRAKIAERLKKRMARMQERRGGF
jgi:periplasmic protein CpxP/Spy